MVKSHTWFDRHKQKGEVEALERRKGAASENSANARRAFLKRANSEYVTRKKVPAHLCETLNKPNNGADAGSV